MEKRSVLYTLLVYIYMRDMHARCIPFIVDVVCLFDEFYLFFISHCRFSVFAVDFYSTRWNLNGRPAGPRHLHSFSLSPSHFFVIVPPKIDYIAPSTRVDVSKGASIKLECRATGNPPPKLVWTRKVCACIEFANI